MSEKTVKKIKEIPKSKGLSGLLLAAPRPHEWTPTELLDRIGAAKEGRPVFVLRPMDYIQRREFEAIKDDIQAEAMLWAKGKGVDLATASTVEAVALAKHINATTDTTRTNEIMRRCIIDIKGVGECSRDLSNDCISEELFFSFGKDLISAVFEEIERISYLTEADILGL